MELRQRCRAGLSAEAECRVLEAREGTGILDRVAVGASETVAFSAAFDDPATWGRDRRERGGKSQRKPTDGGCIDG